MDIYCDRCQGPLIYSEGHKEFRCRHCGNTKKQPCDKCGNGNDKEKMSYKGIENRKVQTGHKNWGEDDGMYYRDVKIYECNECEVKKKTPTKKRVIR